jgi:hypothetical protein
MRLVLGISNVDGNVAANDAREIIGLCRAGRLYEIEKWIADDRSLDISETIKRELAVESSD